MLVHALGGLPDRLHFFRRMAIVVGSEVIFQHIMLFTLDDWELYEAAGDVVILGMIIYTVVLGNRAYHAAQEPDRKRLGSRFLLLLGFSLFCQVFDTAMSLFFLFSSCIRSRMAVLASYLLRRVSAPSFRRIHCRSRLVGTSVSFRNPRRRLGRHRCR